MGGFTLHGRGNPARVLEANDLEELLDAEMIEWPTITKGEIEDRSRGDDLSKTIVLFETTWFVRQCIARGAYGLTVTELEVVTVAFPSLTGAIYSLWWDKRLDVRCSISVHLLDGLKIEGDTTQQEETGPQIIPSSNISNKEIPERDENINPNPLPTTSVEVDISTRDPACTRMERFRSFRRGACEEYGSLFGLEYVFVWLPLSRLSSPLNDMWAARPCKTKSFKYSHFIHLILPTVSTTASYHRHL